MACISKRDEEADGVIKKQALPFAKQGSTVHLLCDDTEAFARLVHFYDADTIPTNRTRAAIHMGAQAQGYYSTHYLTECSYGLWHGEVYLRNRENKRP